MLLNGCSNATTIRALSDFTGWLHEQDRTASNPPLAHTNLTFAELLLAAGDQQPQPATVLRQAYPQSLSKLSPKKIWSVASAKDLPTTTRPLTSEEEARAIDCLIAEINKNYKANISSAISTEKLNICINKMTEELPNLIVVGGGGSHQTLRSRQNNQATVQFGPHPRSLQQGDHKSYRRSKSRHLLPWLQQL